MFHEDYADLLIRMGKIDQAIVESKFGIELDPDAERSYYDAATIYDYGRQFDKALEMAQKAKTMQRDAARSANPHSLKKPPIDTGEINEGGGLRRK